MKRDAMLFGMAALAIVGALALVVLTPVPALASACSAGAYCQAYCTPPPYFVTQSCANCSRDGVNFECKCPLPPGYNITYNGCQDGRFPRAGSCY